MQEVPPYDYLYLLAQTHPDCVATYLHLWNDKNASYEVVYSRDMIENIKNLSWTKFKNNIRKIAHQGLGEYILKDDTIFVTLAAYEIDAEGFTLC